MTDNPRLGSSAEHPIERIAARALVLDADGRILLMQHSDPDRPADGHWWITPGGGRAPHESAQECAARELWEESGLVVEPAVFSAAVLERTVTFPYQLRWIRQTESFHLVRLTSTMPTVAPTALDEDEQEHLAVLGVRWWAVADLAAAETEGTKVFPVGLVDLLNGLM